MSTTLTPNEMLSKILVLATTTHEGQYDKAGMPYILHPLKVAHYLKTNDLELMCIAIGHDLIEDHGKIITYTMLRELGFSERVINGIRCITKLPGETYEEYKAKVMSCIDAIIVKMADLRHNTDIRRLKGVTEKDIKRTVKYHQFYIELEAKLNDMKTVA